MVEIKTEKKSAIFVAVVAVLTGIGSFYMARFVADTLIVIAAALAVMVATLLIDYKFIKKEKPKFRMSAEVWLFLFTWFVVWALLLNLYLI